MPASLVDEAGKAALTAAIQAVEAVSSAEVVITVRPSSGFYLHADLLVGVVVGVATLTFLLFSHVEFAIPWFVVDPIVMGALAAWLSSRSPGLRRLLTPRRLRRRWVRAAAYAAFYERGVRLTAERTGILVYVSHLERDAALIGDQGVVTVVPPERWHAAADAIAGAVARGRGSAGIAAEVSALAGLLGPYLPRAEDDINELPDEVNL
ncbi:MAG: hypothetical protein KC420_05710 [Myxococcales bacterium]|nr:hypothetical protein [Myxococcales bacterium]MCB9569229.1 hypothetical protein [Myxococcales bacterium]MCB9706101.1 hypothetical protein [Myxococcales bacterium]